MDEESVSSDVDNTEENQDEDEEAVEIRPLDHDIIVPGLSLLCRTGNGLRHAFIKVILKDKRLSDIAAISDYVHLRFMDVSNNRISDLSPLSSLTQLLWLKWLSMAANRLTEVQGLVGLALENLNLSGNCIERLNGLESCLFSKLATLELRGNRLTTTSGINLPNLQRLYLAQNLITNLEGIETLENLTTLHLRNNKLANLDGLSANMKCLQYLNVRSNDFLDETCLLALGQVSATLRVVVLSENPLDGTTDYRPYVLTLIPKLERLDKEPVSLEERAEVWKTIKELKEETA
nr:leucine-rich repeat-containing protein 23 isoform X2 [Syngnathus scovelli]